MGSEGHISTCLRPLLGQLCPRVKWPEHPEPSPLFGRSEMSVPVFSESLGTHGCLGQEARVAGAPGEEVGCVDVSVVTT